MANSAAAAQDTQGSFMSRFDPLWIGNPKIRPLSNALGDAKLMAIATDPSSPFLHSRFSPARYRGDFKQRERFFEKLLEKSSGTFLTGSMLGIFNNSAEQYMTAAAIIEPRFKDAQSTKAELILRVEGVDDPLFVAYQIGIRHMAEVLAKRGETMVMIPSGLPNESRNIPMLRALEQATVTALNVFQENGYRLTGLPKGVASRTKQTYENDYILEKFPMGT